MYPFAKLDCNVTISCNVIPERLPDKQVPVPSVYFIGKQGVPLEIVKEASDVKSFQGQLNLILQKGGLSPICK